MRRPSSLAPVLVAALLAAAVPAGARDRPPLRAAVESCATSALPAGREVSFVGSMPAVRGAVRMQMRFVLERRRRGERTWRRVRNVPGFGVWERSAPDRAGFVFHKRVDGLAVRAGYRAVVGFRWEAPSGEIVRRARRRTTACDQPDLRPNLVPGVLTGVLDARPGLAVYRLVVRNAGRSAAGPFGVRVAGGTADVRGLAAGAERTVVVVAPICLAGTTTRAVVDAGDRVDESIERGNAAARRCPLWGA